jgi:hypothetical protein
LKQTPAMCAKLERLEGDKTEAKRLARAVVRASRDDEQVPNRFSAVAWPVNPARGRRALEHIEAELLAELERFHLCRDEVSETTNEPVDEEEPEAVAEARSAVAPELRSALRRR